MIRIVYWKNIVGRDFMGQFSDIERMIENERKIGIETSQITAKVKKKMGDEVVDKWAKKRSRMRFCGFETIDRQHFRTGWYDAVWEGGDLKFRFSSRETNPEYMVVDYVSIDAFKADRDVFEGDEGNRHRRVYGLAKNEARNPETGPREDDFIPEEEEV